MGGFPPACLWACTSKCMPKACWWETPHGQGSKPEHSLRAIRSSPGQFGMSSSANSWYERNVRFEILPRNSSKKNKPRISYQEFAPTNKPRIRGLTQCLAPTAPGFSTDSSPNRSPSPCANWPSPSAMSPPRTFQTLVKRSHYPMRGCPIVWKQPGRGREGRDLTCPRARPPARPPPGVSSSAARGQHATNEHAARLQAQATPRL